MLHSLACSFWLIRRRDHHAALSSRVDQVPRHCNLGRNSIFPRPLGVAHRHLGISEKLMAALCREPYLSDIGKWGVGWHLKLLRSLVHSRLRNGDHPASTHYTCMLPIHSMVPVTWTRHPTHSPHCPRTRWDLNSPPQCCSPRRLQLACCHCLHWRI